MTRLHRPARLTALAVLLGVLAGCRGSADRADLPGIRHDYRIEYTPRRIQLLRSYAKAHYGPYYRATTGSPEMPSIEIDPKVIVVHYTVIKTLAATVRAFMPETLRGRPALDGAGAANVGVQYIVDRDGTIHQTMPDNYFARHCIGLNHCAIGIENVASADLPAGAAKEGDAGSGALTLAQLRANIRLVRHLKRKYPALRVLIGHHEYRDLEQPTHPAHDLFFESDPDYRTKKSDPGPRFMAALREGVADLLLSEHGGQLFGR